MGAGDRQRRAAPHVGGPQLPEEQGRRSRGRPAGPPGESLRQEVKRKWILSSAETLRCPAAFHNTEIHVNIAFTFCLKVAASF